MGKIYKATTYKSFQGSLRRFHLLHYIFRGKYESQGLGPLGPWALGALGSILTSGIRMDGLTPENPEKHEEAMWHTYHSIALRKLLTFLTWAL